MCGIEVKISPRKSEKLAERKKTKGKTTDGLKEEMKTIAVPEMLNGTTYLHNCNARDAKWNHLPTFQPP